MSINLALNNDAVTVSNGTDTVTFDGPDVARFAEALANPGKPAFQQDRMLFTTSVATSFGLWLLQDGSLSVFLKGDNQVLDPTAATDFANTLLGPVLIGKAKFKVGDDIYSGSDHVPDMNDKAVRFSYQTYGKVVAVTPDPTHKSVIYSVETDDGKKVDIRASVHDGYLTKAEPIRTYDVTQQVGVSLVRDIQIDARSRDDAILKAKTIRDPGIWSLKTDAGTTLQLSTLTTTPSVNSASIAGAVESEGWRQDAQGRIRSSDATKFASDTDATRFVTQRALEGSTPHQTALRKRLGV